MIYCFSNDFDTILIQCYDFGASRANGSKTSSLLHMDCSFVIVSIFYRVELY